MVGTMKIINYDVSCVHCGNNYRARIASGFVPSKTIVTNAEINSFLRKMNVLKSRLSLCHLILLQ